MSKWTLLSIPHTFFLVSHPTHIIKLMKKLESSSPSCPVWNQHSRRQMLNPRDPNTSLVAKVNALEASGVDGAKCPLVLWSGCPWQMLVTTKQLLALPKKTTLLSLVLYELLHAAKKETLTKETRRQEKWPPHPIFSFILKLIRSVCKGLGQASPRCFLSFAHPHNPTSTQHHSGLAFWQKGPS